MSEPKDKGPFQYTQELSSSSFKKGLPSSNEQPFSLENLSPIEDDKKTPLLGEFRDDEGLPPRPRLESAKKQPPKQRNLEDLGEFGLLGQTHQERDEGFTRGGSHKKTPPFIKARMSEGFKPRVSEESLHRRHEYKEPYSAGRKGHGHGHRDDIELSFVETRDEQQIKERSLFHRHTKEMTKKFALPFDAFVDKIKGRDLDIVDSTYPSYKIDKRLIFLGKEVSFPWHVISHQSRFRTYWNVMMVFLMLFQVFWYPIGCTFLYGEEWPVPILIFEFFTLIIYFMDIIINMRTTYSNENNEEIIDTKMMRDNYIQSKRFLSDFVTFLPIPEVFLLFFLASTHKWEVYAIFVMIRMLRIIKIFDYLSDLTLPIFAKLARIFITYFIVINWASCIWFVIIQTQMPETLDASRVWIPNNMRIIVDDPGELLGYYTTMDHVTRYGLTLLSVFMLSIGGDMAPATNTQVWYSVFVGLFGAVSMAYIFGLVTLVITRAHRESTAYTEQLEDLKHKLKVNQIPHNLRVKVMEYFHYSWRKHSVLKKHEDFSELSIPLQRDIALYQHQEMLTKVPLFKDLDPVETLNIVQKFKHSIYMPGDKIVREGERGTDMFFIQDGVVEILLKKPNLGKEHSHSAKANKYDKFFLEKGAYFGEVALLSNSKRSFDANAYEFCILYTFTRSDYESLRREFKDIGPRLKSGLKHYKNTHMDLLIQILQNLDIFEGFTIDELQRIADEYVEELFVDPDRVILDPKERINAMYVIFGGTVNCYDDNEETRQYLNNLKRSNDKDNWTVVDIDENQDIECLDDQILKLEKDELSIIDDKKKLRLEKTFIHGDYFGTLDFDVNEIRCTKFYVSETGCQIGTITAALKSQMENEDPELYEKLKNNMIKYAPTRELKEESESSFSLKNIHKTVLSRKASTFSDIGRKPTLFKTTTLQGGRKEDVVAFQEGLQQLEEEITLLKSLITETNNKFGNLATSQFISPILEPLNIRRGKEKRVSMASTEKEEEEKEDVLRRHLSASLPDVTEEENLEDKTFEQI